MRSLDIVRAQRRERVRRWRIRRPEDVKRHNASSRLKLRTEMFATYGDHCACCGENREAFLSLDHVNRDGAAHRRAVTGSRTGSTRQVLLDLRRRGWPKEGFRILCMNCNWATRFGGACPHQTMYAALAVLGES